ncbi:MAG: ABC transporter ATP-binding protein [Acidimicrobiia bacterium]
MTSEPAASEATEPGARSEPGPGGNVLEINNIEVIYEDVILVLRGLSLAVGEGQIVALLGSNGAGKSTTLKAVAGLLPTEHGEVTQGNVVYQGRPIHKLNSAALVKLGISLVMEGRRVFEHLTVHENLLSGGYTRRSGVSEDIDLVYGFFPRLKERRSGLAGYLSGGEQQMLAIGRSLMSRPKLMMLDEPSLGLAPLLVAEIFERIKALNAELGTTVLLVEQNARRALEIADHAYVMENGRIVLEGPAAELASNPDVQEFYLGLSETGTRKSYREVKHYKRRKRWL